MKNSVFFTLACVLLCYSSLSAKQITGCIEDECIGHRISNQTMYYEVRSFRGQTTVHEIHIDENGCFEIDLPEVRGYVYIAGMVYNISSIPSRLNLGTVSIPNYSGPMIIRHGINGNEQAVWISNDCAASTFPIGSCNDPQIVYKGHSFVSWPPIIDGSVSNCVRLTLDEICDPISGVQNSATSGWIVSDPNPSEHVFDVNSMLQGLDFYYDVPHIRSTFEVACCMLDEEFQLDPSSIEVIHTDVRNLKYELGVEPGVANFRWMADDDGYIENLNNDPDPNDGSMPNDGTIKTLGNFSAGVNGSIFPATGSIISETILRIYRMDDDCLFEQNLLYAEFRPGLAPPLNYQFNLQNINGSQLYFLNQGGIDFDYETSCFKFEIEVRGTSTSQIVCEPIIASGLFRVTDDCGFCRRAGDNASADVTLFYPNPSNGTYWVDAGGEVTEVSVYDIAGRRMQSSFDGTRLTIADAIPGAYVFNVLHADGSSHQQMIIKQ